MTKVMGFNRASVGGTTVRLKSKEAIKKRLMSAYKIKSSLKNEPTLKYNLDLADYTER